MQTFTPSNRQIAQVVKDAIEGAGKSQRAVAEECGIPLTTLSRRLTGSSPFIVTELEAVANAVSLRSSEIMQRAELLAASIAA